MSHFTCSACKPFTVYHDKLTTELDESTGMNSTVGFSCSFERGLCQDWTSITPQMSWLKKLTDQSKDVFIFFNNTGYRAPILWYILEKCSSNVKTDINIDIRVGGRFRTTKKFVHRHPNWSHAKVNLWQVHLWQRSWVSTSRYNLIRSTYRVFLVLSQVTIICYDLQLLTLQNAVHIA